MGYSPRAMGDSADNYTNTTESDIMIKRQMIRAEFYNTYDVMTGVRGIIFIFLIECQSTCVYRHKSLCWVIKTAYEFCPPLFAFLDQNCVYAGGIFFNDGSASVVQKQMQNPITFRSTSRGGHQGCRRPRRTVGRVGQEELEL